MLLLWAACISVGGIPSNAIFAGSDLVMVDAEIVVSG